MTYFVTGGAGSFGKHFVRHILGATDARVVVYSRDELKHYEMAKTVDTDRVRFVVGDVRDRVRLRQALKEIDDPTVYVVHAAALKHVTTGERCPTEAVDTNVLGTRNVVEAARDRDCTSMVLLSTDKACAPVNLYGATKMCAERIVVQAGQRVVRYGNVIGSSGSVLHVFNQQKKDGVFRVTDKRMTRFAVTFDYAISLVLKALRAEPGTTLVSKVPAFRVVDLARSFDDAAPFVETGILPGEKLHEALLTGYERARAIDLGDYWVLPPDAGERLPDDVVGYSSDQGPFMTLDELREVVRVSV